MAKKLNTLLTYLNAWLPPILWAGVIFALSAQSVLPQFEASGLEYFSKKVAHLGVYAILYLLFSRAITLQSPLKTTQANQYLFPFLLCLLYAISDEFHQSLIPGRYATFRDIGFDTLGITTAFFWKYGYI